jgi:5-methyltetrahydrofolate--homocysteine methyltransferase
MTKQEFKALVQSKIVILDGATGSNLQKRGMPAGVCPEEWILEHREVLIGLQKEYIEAGTDILYAPTFSGNRLKLMEYGLEDRLEEMNIALVGLSRQAVEETGKQGSVFVAGDLTMTGEQLEPVGNLQFEELVDIYKEQVRAIVKAGADLIVVETMMSLQECRAAMLAVKETCDLPVMVTLTFNEDGRTLYGSDPVTAAVVMEKMGADAVGVNCSTGPEKMNEVVEKMRAYVSIPLIAKPNAGLPKLVDGVTEYEMGAEEFARGIRGLIEHGADIVGGCCGTTPEHIALAAKAAADCFKEKKAVSAAEAGESCLAENTASESKTDSSRLGENISSAPEAGGSCFEQKEELRFGKKASARRLLTTETKTVEIDLNGRFMVVGERINPTGKKALQAELREGKLGIVRKMAEEQRDNGADILDINMGMNGIDEKEMMLKVVKEVTRIVNLPLCIDSSHIDVIEAALRIYPGRALINSISLESEKFEKLIPIAKKYGAMFILLPLSDKGLPENIEEKKEIIHKILERAYSLGLTKEDIIVDGLVATVGANKNAALETMETIRYCKNELGLATICGLSNISFGLPERTYVNSTFLALAIREGLTMAIANPSQDLLMNAAFAADLLMAKEQSDIRYIERVTNHPITVLKGKNVQAAQGKQDSLPQEGAGEEKENAPKVYTEVVKGNRAVILDEVKKELDRGTEPSEILDHMLIPAINHVGDLFDKKKYFLPQLISSAETMEIAINYLEPMLQAKNNGKVLGTIVMATVEGDIHDIGKNLVVLMLKNYGYRVIDLGKDVSAEKIVETARKEDADIIGLSALMTTTMMEMKNVIEQVKKAGIRAQVIIGGAVTTQGFADEIGAHGYSGDAQEAVKLVQRLLGHDKKE